MLHVIIDTVVIICALLFISSHNKVILLSVLYNSVRLALHNKRNIMQLRQWGVSEYRGEIIFDTLVSFPCSSADASLLISMDIFIEVSEQTADQVMPCMLSISNTVVESKFSSINTDLTYWQFSVSQLIEVLVLC